MLSSTKTSIYRTILGELNTYKKGNLSVVANGDTAFLDIGLVQDQLVLTSG